MKQSYKELKNLLHNDLKITKQDILDMIQIAVNNEVHQVLNQSPELLERVVTNVLKQPYFNGQMRSAIQDEMKKVIMNKFDLNFDIKMKPTDIFGDVKKEVT